ncbi:GntR family transcriptional regulator [Alloalcanivorax sp. C16-2]|uniref:GntR family transcriptional regulator n=1 Tax=Alloalcanivorax TaxID=3020832 RepID=UPI0019342C05|nr:GntR family transcriptional regulator [Alloalcanivorax marinus]MBL7251798.1 GntR family transcriptional regulator [Alloalcanivorax marinus]
MADQNDEKGVFDASPIPLYVQLADIIRYRIDRGVWQEGSMLPPIETLMKEFSVSRITVRQALQLLARSGLLKVQRGVGTLVLKSAGERHPVKVETTLDALVEAYRGDEPVVTNISDSSTPPSLTESDGVPAAAYHHLRRVHARKGVKYCVISIYLEQGVFEKAEQRFRDEIILPVLMSLDLTVAQAKQSITISKADLEVSRLLDMPLGDPIANVRRVLVDPDNTIIYVAEAVYRGDYIHLEMDLKA